VLAALAGAAAAATVAIAGRVPGIAAVGGLVLAFVAVVPLAAWTGVHAEAACGSFSSLIDRVLSHDESLKQVVVDAGAHPRQTDARDTGHGGGD